MKRGFVIGLLVLYSFILLRPLIPLIDFYANQSYIAKNLCVNRDKPWLHCNGHCYLMKKLKKVEQEEQQTKQQSLTNILRLPEYCAKTFQVTFKQNCTLLEGPLFPEKEDFYDPLFVTTIFHPPIV